MQVGLPQSYERLETLGDSFLKMIINLHLYARHPLRDEGYLSQKSSILVSNHQLYELATRKSVPSAISATPLSRTTWRPFGSGFAKEAEGDRGHELDQINPPSGTHVLSDKQVADVMEALLGSAVISGNPDTHGVEDGAHTLRAIYSTAIPDDWSKYYEAIKGHVPGKDGSWKYEPGLEKLIATVETFIGYKFSHPGWLIEALTHSTSADEYFNSYQRLEFLGMCSSACHVCC